MRALHRPRSSRRRPRRRRGRRTSRCSSDAANRDARARFRRHRVDAGRHARRACSERDRQALPGTLPGDGYRLIVDVFAEFGRRARARDLAARHQAHRRGRAPSASGRSSTRSGLSSVENLYRLALNATKQFTARNLKIAAEDLDLTLPEGSVFVAEIDRASTAAGADRATGRSTSTRRRTTEKGQVKIFCGARRSRRDSTSAYIRVNPADFAALIERVGSCTPLPVGRARAAAGAGDLPRGVAEFVRHRPRRSEPRRVVAAARAAAISSPRSGRAASTRSPTPGRHRGRGHHAFRSQAAQNIALYPSKEKLATRGRFYNEDDLVDYDVLDYDIEVAVDPERQWIEGRARLRLKVRALRRSAR